MKLFLIMAILISFCLIGYLIRNFYIKRQLLFSDFKLFIQNYIGEINFKKSNYLEILKSINLSSDFSQIILNKNLPSYISIEEQKLFNNFIDTIGTFDIDGEINNCKNFLIRVDNILEICKTEIHKKGDLYFKLSVVIGLILCIILI